MKPFYILILVLLYTSVVQSQMQSVIGNTGGTFKNDKVIVEYTLGETIINTFSNNLHVITQGFHQPDILRSTATVQFADIVFDIETFPNPFIEKFNVQIKGTELPVRRLNLVDLYGRLVNTYNLTGTNQSLEIEASALPIGMYFLQYTDGKRHIIFTQKVLKAE